MGEVICPASPKGGAGKTVLTATFGTLLASLGKNILLVDTDAATNGLTLFYLRDVAEKERQDRTVAGLFEGGSFNEWEELDVVPIGPGLSLLPAKYHFRDTEVTDVATFERRLHSIVARARQLFDYVFLDAQAGADEYARRALSSKISDKVVIVSEYDPSSAVGVERLKTLFADDLAYQRTWILLNKVLPESAKSFSEFLQVARYISPIPWQADVVLAFARRSLALDSETGNTYTLAIVQSLRALLPECEADFDYWLSARSGFLRTSLEGQIKLTEAKLTGIEIETLRSKSQRKMRFRWIIGTTIVIVAATLTLSGLGNMLILGLFVTVMAMATVLFRDGVLVSGDKPSVDVRLQTRRFEERLQELYTLRDLGPSELIEQRNRIDKT